MHAFTFFAALSITLLVLWEIFETIVLPRKIDRRFRVTRYYYLTTWAAYCFWADRVAHPKRRSTFLSIYGPLSLIGLFLFWEILLVFAFAVMNWSVYSVFKLPDGESPNFLLELYVSGTTMTTLGLGDVTPQSSAARLTTVVEAGLGLGLVALVISYLPTLYQAFSRREMEISLLDARAGSPPSATELLLRSARRGHPEHLTKLLSDWERWCAEIMESHISYPVLCYFRSQHTNQSWLTAMTAILDACALSLACLEHESRSQAHLTFAMGRHAVVDIAQVFHQEPCSEMADRMPRDHFQSFCDELRQEGFKLRPGQEAWERLDEMRRMYEPYVFTLSRLLRIDLPPWARPEGARDNWVSTKQKEHSENF